jgi:hypothetical protein
MSYSLSFSNEFFWENSDYPQKTDSPKSVYEALYNLWLNNRKEFNLMVSDVLKIRIAKLNYLPDHIIFDLVEKAIEYDTCANINTPVEIYINKNHSVKVF